MSEGLLVSSDRRRRAAILLLLAGLANLMLGGIAYLGINHHVPLHRPGLFWLARLIAAHPIRWAGLVTAVGLVLLVLVWRLLANPVVSEESRGA